MRSNHRCLIPILLCILAAPGLFAEKPHTALVAEYFQADPLTRADAQPEGAVEQRLEWKFDQPAYPGDRPGSLTALYDARMEAGRLGFPLPQALTQDDTFTVAAMFVIQSDGFYADPFGFFQISWGLWNQASTGFERTGNFTNFATDTFELLEFDYFPNPGFGGPFVSPTLFGVATPDAPTFPFDGAFSNFSFSSVALDLPLDQPLLALMEHRPEDQVLVVSLYRILDGNHLLPLDGGVTSVPLSFLSVPQYSVDTLGLTLWHDGFTGDPPSLFAYVTYHALIVLPGLLDRPERILHVPPTRP